MKAKEFLNERGININIPINISIPGDGKDISVNAGDKEPATEEKYSISPLQQELELQKAELGKNSPASLLAVNLIVLSASVTIQEVPYV